jgi:predicted RNase H-like HicB family nuclease
MVGHVWLQIARWWSVHLTNSNQLQAIVPAPAPTFVPYDLTDRGARTECGSVRPVGCICGLDVRARAMLDCECLPHPGLPMQLEFTAVYRKVPEGYVAFVEELPGANTQGATLEEARENLREAVELTLEANRALAEEDLAGEDVIREPLKLTA